MGSLIDETTSAASLYTAASGHRKTGQLLRVQRVSNLKVPFSVCQCWKAVFGDPLSSSGRLTGSS